LREAYEIRILKKDTYRAAPQAPGKFLIANVTGTFQSVQRISFMATRGIPDIPWYVHEIPTIFVSVNCPFHLAHVSQLKCYINTYCSPETTARVLVEKLLGKSEFVGVSPIDAFCGFMDTRT